MEDFTLGNIIISLLFTWIVGLTPPLLIRYIFLKRPISKASALVICGFFLFSNLVLFIAAGSKSKSHGALILIAFVSYYILTRVGKRDRDVMAKVETTEIRRRSRYNIKQGLFRLWIVVSVLWIGFVIVAARSDVADTFLYYFDKGPLIEKEREATKHDLFNKRLALESKLTKLIEDEKRLAKLLPDISRPSQIKDVQSELKNLEAEETDLAFKKLAVNIPDQKWIIAIIAIPSIVLISGMALFFLAPVFYRLARWIISGFTES